VDTFLQQIVNGLTLGCVYAVVALGYTMVYGIIQLINFAHGEVVMIGCMTAFSVIVALAPSGAPPLLIVTIGTLVAVPVCMAVGYLVERIAYRPLRSAPRLAPLITAIGMSIVLQHLALLVWSRNIIAFPQIIELKLYHFGSSDSSAAISNVQIVIIFASVAMMAGLLALAERFSNRLRTMDNVTLKDAMIVGFAQAGALIPGVSRSGSTLTAALFLNLHREEAARFSFLLGVPAIALAGLKELYELHKVGLDLHGWSILIVGLVIASISAFVAIWGLLRILENFSAWPFVIYRAFIGIVLLVGVAIGWLS